MVNLFRSFGISAKMCPRPSDITQEDFDKQKEILHILARGFHRLADYPLSPKRPDHPQNPENLVIGTVAANTHMMISEQSAKYLNKYFPGLVTFEVVIDDYSLVKNPKFTEKGDSKYPENIRVAKKIKCIISLKHPQDREKLILKCTQEINVFGCNHPPRDDFAHVSQALRDLVSECITDKHIHNMDIDKTVEGENLQVYADGHYEVTSICEKSNQVTSVRTPLHTQGIKRDRDSDLFATQDPSNPPSPAPQPPPYKKSR